MEITAEYDAWLRDLDERVIQGEYGYEDGEFTVYPESWVHMFEEGLTPDAAFKRALDATTEARHAADAERKRRYEEIRLNR